MAGVGLYTVKKSCSVCYAYADDMFGLRTGLYTSYSVRLMCVVRAACSRPVDLFGSC